jgi:MoxR-like ATPase
LYRAAQARALLERRSYVVPDDIKRLALPVLAHRILAKTFRPGRRAEVADSIIEEIVGRTPIPA